MQRMLWQGRERQYHINGGTQDIYNHGIATKNLSTVAERRKNNKSKQASEEQRQQLVPEHADCRPAAALL